MGIHFIWIVATANLHSIEISSALPLLSLGDVLRPVRLRVWTIFSLWRTLAMGIWVWNIRGKIVGAGGEGGYYHSVS